jgi:gamma-glutamylcyclotransferase (GGCT)/AIG2-like uncharacterized protein YtfP
MDRQTATRGVAYEGTLTDEGEALVFMYGTLKRGHYNCQRFGLEPCFLREATVPGITLIDLGAYPGAVSALGEVDGEVFRVKLDLLRSMDGMEFGAGYDRLPMTTKDGTKVNVYVLMPDYVDSIQRRGQAEFIGRAWPRVKSEEELAAEAAIKEIEEAANALYRIASELKLALKRAVKEERELATKQAVAA